MSNNDPQKDQVSHRPVIEFNLSLSHGMIGFCSDVVGLISFEIAKICLPELVDSSCGILELIFGRNNGVDRRCY